MAEWKGKPLVVDHKRNVDSEMIECKVRSTKKLTRLMRGENR